MRKQRPRRVRVDLGGGRWAVAPEGAVLAVYCHVGGLTQRAATRLRPGDLVACASKMDAGRYATLAEYFHAGGIAELCVARSVEILPPDP